MKSFLPLRTSRSRHFDISETYYEKDIWYDLIDFCLSKLSVTNSARLSITDTVDVIF